MRSWLPQPPPRCHAAGHQSDSPGKTQPGRKMARTVDEQSEPSDEYEHSMEGQQVDADAGMPARLGCRICGLGLPGRA